MVKPLAALLLTAGWINASAAEIDTISYESLVPAGSPCDTTSRERDRITQPVERVANFVMIVSNKGHCAHHMSFQEVDVIASELIAECEWVAGDPEYGCHIVMVNDKWVAKASDFKHLAPARIRWNKRTHTLKHVQTMTLNQRARLLTRGEIDHNLAFGNFDFTAALSKDEIPNYGVVALTQYGREPGKLIENPWQSRSADRIVRRLQQDPNAIFLAPIQTIGYGLNSDHRKAIALRIARQIESSSGRRVHDPLLIQRAFGPGVRTIPTDQILEMAARVGASVVVVAQIGHNNANEFVLRTQVARLGGDTPKLTAPKALTGRQSFDPSDNLVANLADYGQRIAGYVTRMSGGSNIAPRASAPDSEPEALIPTADNLARSEGPALSVISQYQWLGSLVPESNPYLRGELFARSLALLLESTHLTDSRAQLLKARALAEIGAVRAARSVTQTNEQGLLHRAYQAFTLGQIDAMQRSLGELSPSVMRDLLLTDQIRLQKSIGRAAATWPLMLALTVKYPSWEQTLLGDLDAQRLIQTHTRPHQCDSAVQFCPNQALALVSDAIALDAITAAVKDQAASGLLLDYIADLDTVIAGHPTYEEAFLRTSAQVQSSALQPEQQDWLEQRRTAAQAYLQTGLEFSDSELIQPGKTYPVVMFPAHKYRRANDQDFPPVFSNGRKFQYSRFSQGAGLVDFFFFRMPGQAIGSLNAVRQNAKR